MKYIFTLIVISFTGTVIWTAGTYSIEIEELEARKIAVEQSRLSDGRLINDAYDEIMLKRKQSNNNSISEDRDSINSKNNTKDILPYSSQSENPIQNNIANETIDQAFENVVVENLNDDSELIQEKSIYTPKEVKEYKKGVLVRLFSQTATNDQKSAIEKIEIEQTPLLVIDQELNDTIFDPLQIQSETILENSIEKFNFSKEENVDLVLTSETTNGRILPNVRLTVENNKGQILLEGSTDIQGEFQKRITKFTGEKIFVRYYGVGLSQEKVEIVKEGEGK